MSKPTLREAPVRSWSAINFEKLEVLPPRYDIPYFAHQELNPDVYSADVRMPVGGPPMYLPHNNDGDENGVGSDFDIDDYDFDEDDTWTRKKISGNNATNGSASKTAMALIGHTTHSYKRLKFEGGRPALAKKVVADMDSDDELIVQMKQTKHTEKEISDRLKAEGRTVYHSKTIGTRWARLKRVLQERNDELLDAELTDWHEGDDDVLKKAVEKADAMVEEAKRKAEEKKWILVADALKDMKASSPTPVTNFSQNSCRARYEALQNGTAKPTPESVDDPDETVRNSIASRVRKQNQVVLYRRDVPLPRREAVRRMVKNKKDN